LISYHEGCVLGLKKGGDQHDKAQRKTRSLPINFFKEFIFAAGIFKDHEQLILNFGSRGINTFSIIKL
jgi:hypothetical protein